MAVVTFDLLTLLATARSDDHDWQRSGLCAQIDPDTWFPEQGVPLTEAKRICLRCEVRAECLHAALAGDERFGVWGGLSTGERDRLKRQLVAKVTRSLTSVGAA